MNAIDKTDTFDNYIKRRRKMDETELNKIIESFKWRDPYSKVNELLNEDKRELLEFIFTAIEYYLEVKE